MSTVTQSRPPSACPAHPRGGAVRSEKVHTTDSIPELSITQHLCAEPGCSHPLGWEYHDGTVQGFRHGAGEADPRLRERVLRAKQAEDNEFRLVMTTLAVLAGYSLIYIVIHQLTGDFWHWSHTLSTVAYLTFWACRAAMRGRGGRAERMGHGDPGETP